VLLVDLEIQDMSDILTLDMLSRSDMSLLFIEFKLELG